jgi:hypothetical protein
MGQSVGYLLYIAFSVGVWYAWFIKEEHTAHCYFDK